VAQVIKRYAKRRVKEVVQWVRQGTQEAVLAQVARTQRCCEVAINTACIERLNATFRARLAPLARRTRCGVRQRATLEAGMWLVGCCYNFCWDHRSLRDIGEDRREKRTPAQAAVLTITAGR
jgi:hypothetical protein